MSQKYYIVTNLQIVIAATLIAVITAALVMINIQLKEYFLLPVVVKSGSECVTVVNYRNNDAYSCNDLNTILRKFRTEIK